MAAWSRLLPLLNSGEELWLLAQEPIQEGREYSREVEVLDVECNRHDTLNECGQIPVLPWSRLLNRLDARIDTYFSYLVIKNF